MTQTQVNSLNMFRAVVALLESKPSEWSTLTPVVEVVNATKTILSQVDQTMKNQVEHNPVGYTQQKETRMEAMLKSSFKLASKLKAFAKRSNNQVLLAAVDHSVTSLERGSEIEVIKRCQNIAKKAVEFLPLLTDYMVTQTEIDQLNISIAEVEPIVSKRDAVLSERKTATSGIPELIREGRKQLEILDDMIDGMIDNDELVESYFNARKINDRSASGAKSKETSKAVSQ